MRYGTAIFGALAAALAAGPAMMQVGVLGTPTTGEADAETVAELSTPAAAPLRLEVSVSDRKLHVYRGDERVESYPVAVGKSDHPTPKGSFTIGRVIWNPRWVPPKVPWAKGKTAKGPGDPNNPMGRVKMFFKEPDYYIHGTNNEGSLGSAASHGCIRMANSDVIELAKVVMEHGGEPRDSSWFERVVNRVKRTQEVRLSEPVRVVIRA